MSKLKIFVGGIHGSGKGTICSLLVDKLGAIYISASKLLHWDRKSKQVDDVSENQRILTELLIENTKLDSSYIIDGHFALWNIDKHCEEVPIDTFLPLDLKAIVLTTCNPEVIQDRLFNRDKISYKLEEIKELQELEEKRAKVVSEYLNIPLFFIDTTRDFDLEVLKKIML
ncbi:MAG: AAA family ATPase [Bacteroidales bacterium]|jgi:adenylate kinase|nr:AAA family ATPase [Bacteroidales bacterium]